MQAALVGAGDAGGRAGAAGVRAAPERGEQKRVHAVPRARVPVRGAGGRAAGQRALLRAQGPRLAPPPPRRGLHRLRGPLPALKLHRPAAHFCSKG